MADGAAAHPRSETPPDVHRRLVSREQELDVRVGERTLQMAQENLDRLNMMVKEVGKRKKFKSLLANKSASQLSDLSGSPTLAYDRLVLGNELGRGEFATVRSCTILARPTSPTPEQPAGLGAVKMLRDDMASNATAVEDIRAEAVLLSHISHPHVLGAIWVGFAPQGSYFIVLPRFDTTVAAQLPKKGDSFCKNFSANKQWPVKRGIKLGLQLASALAHLHDEAFSEAGAAVMHRDLKPQNLGLMGYGESERLVLCDFGLATLVRQGESTVDTNDSLECRKPTGPTGSLRYMAPEVALAQNYDETCDIYSWAIVVWQMVSKKTPYFGMGGIAGHKERVVIGGERPPIPKGWPAPLVEVLNRAWGPLGARSPMRHIVSVLKKLSV